MSDEEAKGTAADATGTTTTAADAGKVVDEWRNPDEIKKFFVSTRNEMKEIRTVMDSLAQAIKSNAKPEEKPPGNGTKSDDLATRLAAMETQLKNEQNRAKFRDSVTAAGLDHISPSQRELLERAAASIQPPDLTAWLKERSADFPKPATKPGQVDPRTNTGAPGVGDSITGDPLGWARLNPAAWAAMDSSERRKLMDGAQRQNGGLAGIFDKSWGGKK